MDGCTPDKEQRHGDRVSLCLFCNGHARGIYVFWHARVTSGFWKRLVWKGSSYDLTSTTEFACLPA